MFTYEERLIVQEKIAFEVHILNDNTSGLQIKKT